MDGDKVPEYDREEILRALERYVLDGWKPTRGYRDVNTNTVSLMREIRADAGRFRHLETGENINDFTRDGLFTVSIANGFKAFNTLREAVDGHMGRYEVQGNDRGLQTETGEPGISRPADMAGSLEPDPTRAGASTVEEYGHRSLGPPLAQLSRDLNDRLLALGQELNAKRAAYVKAWLAETGLLPSECELVETLTDQGVVITIRKRPTTVADTSSPPVTPTEPTP